MKKASGLLLLFLCLIIISFTVASRPRVASAPVPAPTPGQELDPAVWGRLFPLEYKSYLENAEITQGNSKYRGSIPFSYLDKDPTIKRLFAGNSFALEYNNKRGHVYALEDVAKTKRVSPKTTAACFTCKSPNAPRLIAEMGDAFYSQPFSAVKPQIQHNVSCADCHDEDTMKLRVSRQPFREALKSMGKDPDNLSPTELRSAVCGQCHASYYLNPTSKKVVFPWKFGLKPENMETYYNDSGFVEWTHPESGAPLLKARHPEYETWSTSVHAANNVSCPDCHMPKQEVDGKTISSHHWQSPLNTLEASCTGCHTGSGLKEKVLTVQDEVYAKKQKAEAAISTAIDAIKEADKNSTAEPFYILKARVLQRKAQWRWDFAASENSMGFHNPDQTLKVLDEALAYAVQAKQMADTAAKYQSKNKSQDKSYTPGYGAGWIFF